MQHGSTTDRNYGRCGGSCNPTRIGIAAAETPRWPKIDWVEHAARSLGHEVSRASHSSELVDLFSRSDVVIAGHKSLAGRWPNIRHALEDRRCPFVYWWFDLVATQPGVPIVRQPLFKMHRDTFNASDLVIVKEAKLVHEYREAGIPACFIDQGVPANYPSIRPQRPKWDLLVWGQCGGNYRERSQNAHAVADAGFRVAWAGEQSPGGDIEHLPWTPAEELPILASKARCVLSCGVRNDLAYWSDQFWMATGMGACVIRHVTPSLPEGPYLVYHTDEQLVDAVNWVRKNPDHARELGQEARKWVMENHTIEHRVQEVLASVGIAGTDG